MKRMTATHRALLDGIERRQQEGMRLTDYDHGSLAAIRRSGDRELIARVDTVEQIEASRARKRAAARKAQR
jgi:hypothetical protein